MQNHVLIYVIISSTGGELVKNVEICGHLLKFVENGRNCNKLSTFVDNFEANLLEIIENWYKFVVKNVEIGRIFFGGNLAEICRF